MSYIEENLESKSTRLEARVSIKQKRLFQHAADLRGETLTDFITASLQDAAVKTIQEYEVMNLIGQDREMFISALRNPLPEGKLKQAAANYKKTMLEK